MGKVVLNADMKQVLKIQGVKKTEWRALVRDRAVWDVIFDVLVNQFLKVLHWNGGKCHRAVVIESRHCRLFGYRDNGSCVNMAGTACESDMLKMSALTSVS